MTQLPIIRMTLYKHGVGFFERRAELEGEQVELSFRVEEMNDILKSLTAIDWGGGQVLGIDYATPQTRDELLAGCSIRLSDDRSLYDLLVSLRGRRVGLHLDQAETTTGTLVGVDRAPERQPLATTLVSLVVDATAQVQVVALARVEGVEILDERGASDLRFFLQTSLSQEAYRSVTVRLTPGTHELSVSYIAPAPTWRVSYRLVAEPEAASEGAAGAADTSRQTGRALLQGWGIFDNRLEEDLEGIALSLVAGMPISFIYDLYTPFTPERPVVEEEERVIPEPVSFGAEMKRGIMADALGVASAAAPAQYAPLDHARTARRPSIDVFEQAAAVETEGAALGELFQYNIKTPVSVSRGHSAMVPIAQATLTYRKDLIYNGAKLATHPVATLRLDNQTGLTLERGPVTVIEGGEYVGEALLPFTVVEGEMVVPYAVELGIRIYEDAHTTHEVRGIEIKGAYLRFEEWEVRTRLYRLTNTTAAPANVLVEHPRSQHYELFNTPEPRERTENELRFAVAVPPQAEQALTVSERRLRWRTEEIQKQSYAGLERYLKEGLLAERQMQELTRLLELWEKISRMEQRLQELDATREQIYKAQQQIQSNMQALGQSGKEGALRVRYVEQLEQTEGQLRAIESEETKIQADLDRTRQQIDQELKRLA